MNDLTYLASPYRNPLDRSDLKTCEDRYQGALKATAQLMQEGHIVFSPIVHSHKLADHMPSDLRFSDGFWMEQDLAVLRHCSNLTVLMLDGWEKSKGVAEEMAFARRHGIPVGFLRPDA